MRQSFVTLRGLSCGAFTSTCGSVGGFGSGLTCYPFFASGSWLSARLVAPPSTFPACRSSFLVLPSAFFLVKALLGILFQGGSSRPLVHVFFFRSCCLVAPFFSSCISHGVCVSLVVLHDRFHIRGQFCVSAERAAAAICVFFIQGVLVPSPAYLNPSRRPVDVCEWVLHLSCQGSPCGTGLLWSATRRMCSFWTSATCETLFIGFASKCQFEGVLAYSWRRHKVVQVWALCHTCVSCHAMASPMHL